MKLVLTTHNLTLTKAIQEHLANRLDKLDHLNHRTVDARVTIELDNKRAPDKQFTCAIRLSLPGPDLFAEDAQTDLYAAIDNVARKLEQQIRKRHNKYKARKHLVPARDKRQRQESTL